MLSLNILSIFIISYNYVKVYSNHIVKKILRILEQVYVTSINEEIKDMKKEKNISEKRKPKKYFTTGEFARLCRINKQTLFHYDHIGILQPDIIGDNGYRYYSYLQLDTYYTISMLKELDMPLAEIKKYLNARTPDSFLDLLHTQDKLIDEKLAELQWLKTFIQERISMTEEGINAKPGVIHLEERPEEYYIITEYNDGPDDASLYPALADHFAYCNQNQIYSPYSIGTLLPADTAFESNGSYSYSHIYTKVLPSDLVDVPINVTVMPAGTYAVTFGKEGYENLSELYVQLLRYVHDNGHKAGKYFFEDTLLDEMSEFSFESYTVKLSLPLR